MLVTHYLLRLDIKKSLGIGVKHRYVYYEIVASLLASLIHIRRYFYCVHLLSFKQREEKEKEEKVLYNAGKKKQSKTISFPFFTVY